MDEALLRFIWKFKKLKQTHFVATNGKKIEILDFGSPNKSDGFSFLYAKVRIEGLVLVGNIEVHVRSSDWEKHHIRTQSDCQSLVLYVVYQQDEELDYLEEKSVSTIVIAPFINTELLETWQKFLPSDSDFIACQTSFQKKHIPFQMQEQLLLKKLDEKAIQIEEWMQKSKNDVEFVFYQKLAYTFGLKHNSEVFLALFNGFDAKILQKTKQNLKQLHALFYGLCNALETDMEDDAKIWKTEFEFLKSKFHLKILNNRLNYARQLPPNFPSIRLSQLANLLHSQPHLFSKIISATSVEELKELFVEIKADSYWDSRFQFQKKSTEVYPKILSDEMIERLLINAVLPMRYAYFKDKNENEIERILEFYNALKAEKNTKTKRAQTLGFPMKNAFDSQFFLYLYSRYCRYKNCLNCGIGYQILNHD